MKPLLQRAFLSFLIGYIVVFFSEIFFWYVKPLGIDLFVTTFFYGVVIFFCLSCITYFHVRNIWSLFLVGALFGWLTEGVIVQTIFYFFPLSLSFTGLSWHALISFFFGFYLLRKLLLQNNYAKTVLFCLALGVFWALWFMTWAVEAPSEGGIKLFLEPEQFIFFSFLTTLYFMLTQILLSTFKTFSFKPSRGEVWTVGGFLLLYFLFVAVPAQPPIVFVIPPLFALIFFALWQNKQHEKRKNILTTFRGNITLKNYFLLLIIPLVASVVYFIAYGQGLYFYPDLLRFMHFFVFVLPQVIVGTGFFLLALGKIFFQKTLYRN